MKDYLLNSTMRVFFLVVGSIMWSGIYLTGFKTVHWLLYVPAFFFIFAAITGICPGIIVSKKLLGKRGQKNASNR